MSEPEKWIVWKYEIPMADQFVIEMPQGSQVLAVQLQGKVPTMWFKVYPDGPPCKVKFLLVGTGHEHVEEDVTHMGTFQYGELVFHVFREKRCACHERV